MFSKKRTGLIIFLFLNLKLVVKFDYMVLGREFLSKSKQTTKVVLNDYYFLCVSGTI